MARSKSTKAADLKKFLSGEISDEIRMRNKLRNILISAIIVPYDRKPPDPDTVAALKSSMSAIGLLNPILVQRPCSGGQCFLVAGRNRLQAAEELGWETIDVIELPDLDGPVDAEQVGRLAEIVENLHRRKINELERAHLVVAWVEGWAELQEARKGLSQVGPNPKGGRPPSTGVNAAARNLGMSRNAVSRSLKVATLSPKAKQAALERGLASNQAALLEAAKKADPIKQVAVIERRAAPQEKPKPNSEPPALRNLKAAWEAAGEDVRESFVKWIGQEP